MGKPTGFMEYQRKTGNTVAPLERIKNFKEFHLQLPKKEQQMQAARCMACGVPFCQAGTMIAGMASGCPLQNLVPEWNDLVYLGNYEQAYRRLTKTNCFPEFTSRVCPALCEAACTCNVNGDPVCTKENERAIIENAWATGLITPQPPKVRTGKRVAVVGSGPSGLAAAMQLNRRGHSVTVFERRDRVGGLLRYGIPNMKLDKSVIDRRVDLMKAEGIEFVTNADIGKDVKADKLLKEFDRVLLCCGAANPRDIKAEGRDAEGIYFAVDKVRGHIFGYDTQGNMLFAFGGNGNMDGYFKLPSAIDHMGNDLLVLDAQNASITVFTPTEYGNLIYQAIAEYDAGDYEASGETWRKVMAMNGNYDQAYIGIGRALMRQGEYHEAMKYFKLKWDTTNYSKAFKQYRKMWVEEHIGLIFLLIFLVFILPMIVGKIKKIKWEIDTADIFNDRT